MEHAGRIALVFSLLSWIALACSLIFGGIGPTVAESWLLRTLNGGAVITSLLAVVLAFVALVRGPQRISGGVALFISGAFLLLFTGAIFLVLR
jgi:hypothetical protein